MAREFFCAYHSLIESLTPYGDAECGRLFRAALIYSATGKEEEFRGNERYIWPTIRLMIDRDKASYDAKCEQNRANASGGRPSQAVGSGRNRSPANASGGMPSQAVGSDGGKEEEKEESISIDLEEDARARAREGLNDPKLGKVVSYYMERLGMLSPIAIGDIQSFLYQADLDPDVIIHAIQIAVDEKKTSWSYIKAILQRYATSGFTTLSLVIASEQQFEEKKASDAERKGGKADERGKDSPNDKKRNWGITYD